MPTPLPDLTPIRLMLMVDGIAATAAGAERYVHALALALPRDRFRIQVCTTRDAAPEVRASLAAAGIEHVALGRRGRFDLAPLVRLIRLLRRERIDILHAHKFGSNVWAAIVGRIARVPVVICHEHSWSYEGQPVRRLTDRFVIGRLADVFAAVSEADRERMIALEHVPRAKTAVIPTAYLPRDPAPGDVRAELGIAAGTPVVGALCALRPQKALHVLVEAFGAVLAGHPDAVLVIAGSGPCADELREQADRLGIGERVRLLGHRADADAVWRAFDVGVMSSDFEGMPVAAFEAMANGTPLVATRVGGLPEVLEDGVSGLLVPRRDPAALAAAIGRLLDDPDLRARIAVAGVARVGDFSIERLSERTVELYDERLARSRRRRA